jgi:hypothetical protein
MATLLMTTHGIQSFSPELHRGTYTLYGTVKNVAVPNYPVYRKLRLHDTLTSFLVAETFSNENTGEYVFKIRVITLSRLITQINTMVL